MKFKQVREAAGVTYRQLHYWTRSGWIHPTNPGCGSGRRYEYSDDEARVAVRMGRLVRAGLSPEPASVAARGQFEIAPGVMVLVGEVPP